MLGIRLPPFRRYVAERAEELAKSLTGLNSEQIAKLTHENAMKHYGFDPFAVPTKGAVHDEGTAIRVTGC